MRYSDHNLQLRILDLVLALSCLVVAVAYCRLRQCILIIWRMLREDCFHIVRLLHTLLRHCLSHQEKSMGRSSKKTMTAQNHEATGEVETGQPMSGRLTILDRLKRFTLFMSWLSAQTANGSIVSIRLDAAIQGWNNRTGHESPDAIVAEIGSASLSDWSPLFLRNPMTLLFLMHG